MLNNNLLIFHKYAAAETALGPLPQWLGCLLLIHRTRGRSLASPLYTHSERHCWAVSTSLFFSLTFPLHRFPPFSFHRKDSAAVRGRTVGGSCGASWGNHQKVARKTERKKPASPQSRGKSEPCRAVGGAGAREAVTLLQPRRVLWQKACRERERAVCSLLS